MEDDEWNSFLEDTLREFKQLAHEDNSLISNSLGSDLASCQHKIKLEKTIAAHQGQVATEGKQGICRRGKSVGLANKCVLKPKPAPIKPRFKVSQNSKIKEKKVTANNQSLLHKVVKIESQPLKLQVEVYMDPEENTERIIMDLTNNHLVRGFEDFINNNSSVEETISPKSLPTSLAETSASLQSKFDSNRKPKEWNQDQIEVHDRMSQSLWEERSSYYPDLVPERILGLTTDPGELHFIVEWDGDRWLVRAEDAYRRIPGQCLQFYESLLVWN